VVTTAWVREQLSYNPALGFGGDGQGGLDLINGVPFRVQSPLAFIDGFAAFTAAAIDDSTGGNATGRLINTRRRTFVVDLENPQVPGREAGVYDPITVAALLWDLYDHTNEAGDVAAIPFSELWSVLVTLPPSGFPTVTIRKYCDALETEQGGAAGFVRVTEQQNSIDPNDVNDLTSPPQLGFPASSLIDPGAHAQALAQHLPRSAEGVQDYFVSSQLTLARPQQLTVTLPPGQPPVAANLIGVTVEVLDALTLQPRQAAAQVTPATSGVPIPMVTLQPGQSVIVRISSTPVGRRATFANYNLVMSEVPTLR